jgi:hypothetical protein
LSGELLLACIIASAFPDLIKKSELYYMRMQLTLSQTRRCFDCDLIFSVSPHPEMVDLYGVMRKGRPKIFPIAQAVLQESTSCAHDSHSVVAASKGATKRTPR